MYSADQLQKRLDMVFQNGALFTYEITPGSVTLVASRGWALREYGDSVLVGIIFATIPRRWLHRITKVIDSGDGLRLVTSRGRAADLWPLNTQFVKPQILDRIKNETRTSEGLEAELDAFLEANPHIGLEKF